MRTRHWKQLVRVTGATITIDSDTVKQMTLGELLQIGLQSRCWVGPKGSGLVRGERGGGGGGGYLPHSLLTPCYPTVLEFCNFNLIVYFILLISLFLCYFICYYILLLINIDKKTLI